MSADSGWVRVPCGPQVLTGSNSLSCSYEVYVGSQCTGGNRRELPTPLAQAEGNIRIVTIARRSGSLRGRRPRARTETSRTGAGRPRACLWGRDLRAAPGSPRDRPRVVESAQPAEPRTTCLLVAGEAPRHAMDPLATDPPLVPKASAGRRPEVGAGCGSAARPDLWRGSRETAIPAPTPLEDTRARSLRVPGTRGLPVPPHRYAISDNDLCRIGDLAREGNHRCASACLHAR